MSSTSWQSTGSQEIQDTIVSVAFSRCVERLEFNCLCEFNCL